MGNRGGFKCGREMVEVNAEEEPLKQISINPTGGKSVVRHLPHPRESEEQPESNSENQV